MSLFIAPLWSLNSKAGPANAITLSLAGPFLLACAAGAVARTGLVLCWRRSTVVITTLAFAFATMAAIYSTTLFSEVGVTLGAAVALLGFATWQFRDAKQGAWLLGGGVAFAALFRADSFFLIGIMIPCVMFFVRPGELMRTWRQWAPRLLSPLVVVALWTLYYNNLRFGSILEFGYNGPYDTRGFSTPVPYGLGLQLISPGKSFFVYSPILLVAIPGLVWLWRRQRAVAAVIIAASVVRVCFYAHWWTPVGGSAWGPRFLLPVCALLAIPLGTAVEHVRDLARNRRLATGSFVALGALSIGVQVLGLSTGYWVTEHAVGFTGFIPPAQVNTVLNQRLHHLDWSWAGSPLRRAITLAEHQPTMLHWFSAGRWPVGVMLVLVAAALAAVASSAAVRADGGAGMWPEHRRPLDAKPAPRR